MLLGNLFSDPLFFIAWLLAIAYGITVHEFAHAWAASWQGDDTAKDLGRLTLNPLTHVDMWGLLMLVFAGFGWGRPTPVNQANLKNGKTSDNLVSLAGIFANLFSLLVFALAFKLLVLYGNLGEANLLINFLYLLIQINLVLAVFNLIPLPPLDGSHVLFNILPAKYDNFKAYLSQNGPWILLVIIIADNFLGFNILSSLFRFFWNLIAAWL